MGKIKHKIARYQVALNEPQNNILKEMMLEDAQTEASNFFGIVLVNEYKNRQLAKAKRPQGRPRKEDEEPEEEIELSREEKYKDDLPKTILYMGQRIGPRESKDIDDLQQMFKPK